MAALYAILLEKYVDVF
jgi:hypothetical protein